MIDCFNRFAIAVLVTNQSFAVVIFAIIGTPKRIFTDPGNEFKSLKYLDF